MSFVKCSACPSPADCAESGRCWNTVVIQARSGAKIIMPRSAMPPDAVGVADPRLAEHPVAQANAASWPTGKPAKAAPSPRPAGGSVTEQIFAACDAELAQLTAGGSTAARDVLLKQARAAAIPKLEAVGVNPNSARKGSSMWVAARASGT